jgi:CheY-like chemotaxis protein
MRRRTFGPNRVQVVQTICDQLAAMLERERLVEELQQREQALRAADEAKDAFIATLAHELRNPLAAIRNAVELMKQAATLDERRVTWTRDVIARQLAQLTRLLEDLLDISRLNRNRVELRREDTDLVRALQQALESTRPYFEARSHRLVVELPESAVYLHGDPARLTQVFTNLLHNAAKYTDHGGEIVLALEHCDTEARVRVRDNGIGIESEHLPRVFDMFSQFAARSGGGLGIGLALTRGLVELHGGRIEARSDGPGHGSEFMVTLPLLVERPADSATSGDQVEETEKSAPRRILVVDDNVDAAQTLATMLATQGHDVRTAYGGSEALALVERWPPDAILLDIGMPDMNGYEVCRQLRAQHPAHQTLIVACTGWGQESDRARSHEAGFDEHLVKPIEPRAVTRLLQSIVGLPAAQHA